MVQQLWKTVWWFFQKLIIELPYDLAILLLGLYPKELKTGTQERYLCINVHCSLIYSTQIVETTKKSILQIRKLRHREVRYSDHDHIGEKWWNQD